MNPDFRMHAERTPNPDSIKWVLSQPVAGDSSTASFRESPGEEISPLEQERRDAGLARQFQEQ